MGSLTLDKTGRLVQRRGREDGQITLKLYLKKPLRIYIILYLPKITLVHVCICSYIHIIYIIYKYII